jgi:hypothetical protein
MFKQKLVKIYICGFYSLVFVTVCCLAWLGPRPQPETVKMLASAAAETGGLEEHFHPRLRGKVDDGQCESTGALPDISALRRVLEPVLATNGLHRYSPVTPNSGRHSEQHFAAPATRLLDVAVRCSPDRLVRVSWIIDSWVQPVGSSGNVLSLADRASDDIHRMMLALSVSRIDFDRIKFIGTLGAGAGIDGISPSRNIDVVFAHCVIARAASIPRKTLFELAESISADPAFVTEYR